MKAVIILSWAALALAGAINARDGHCGGDNCARQVTGTRPGLLPLTSRQADCSNFMKTTVVPEAIIVTVTVTVDPEEPISTKAKRELALGAATQAPTAVPAYASACENASQYSSVCACWNITPSIATASAPTQTTTVTVTSDYCEDL